MACFAYTTHPNLRAHIDTPTPTPTPTHANMRARINTHTHLRRINTHTHTCIYLYAHTRKYDLLAEKTHANIIPELR